MFFREEESQQILAAVVIEQSVHCTCHSRPVSVWSLKAFLDALFVRSAGWVNLSHRELAAPNEYVSSHSEVGSMACFVEAIETTGAVFKVYDLSQKMPQCIAFQVCIYVFHLFDGQDMLDCYLRFEFFDIIYVTGRSFRTPFCDKGIKGRMNSHFCRYMFPAIFVENYCFNC